MKGPYLPFEYPDDITPLGIDEPFTIGRSTSDGTAVQLNLSQGPGYIVAGRKGGGTEMLHNLTASLARMPDALVWHIDLECGSLSAPWVLDEDTAVIDWIANTEEEALRMVKAALRIVRRRRTAYAAEMLRNNQTVMPAKPGVPQIVILIEKGCHRDTVTGGQLSAALSELRRLGRAMRVFPLAAHVRGTADHLPIEEKKQAEFALVGRVKDRAEMAFALDWDKDVPVPRHPGQFVISEVDGVDLFDAYHLTPERIRRIASAVASIRAETHLDQASYEAAGDDYTHRWERQDTTVFLSSLRGDEPATPKVDPRDVIAEARELVGDDVPDQLETIEDLVRMVAALIKAVKKG